MREAWILKILRIQLVLMVCGKKLNSDDSRSQEKNDRDFLLSAKLILKESWKIIHV